jgi:hypothetical protein
MSAKSKFNGGRGGFRSSAEVFIPPEATATDRSENHRIPQRGDVIHLPPTNGKRLSIYKVAGERPLEAGLWLPLTGQHLGEKLAFVTLNLAAVAAMVLAGYNATRFAAMPKETVPMVSSNAITIIPHGQPGIGISTQAVPEQTAGVPSPQPPKS